MSRFDECYKIVRELEGGYADEKHDKGGPTNYGVTQETYNDWLEAGGESVRSVKEITESEVKDIYMEYWRDAKCSYIPKPVDLLVFSTAIHSGPKRSIKLLQNCLGVTPDGLFGPITHLSLNEEIAAMGVKHVCELYLQELQYWYLEIVRRDHKQRKFLNGWLNRLEHLKNHV